MTGGVRPRTTIGVADDEALIRTNLRVLLEAAGYTVIEAADGLQAATMLEDERIALVLLDLKMPGRSGLDILRDHQDRTEDVPVIVITAMGGSQAAIEAMKLGAYDYITKPFDLDEVLFAVKRALTQSALVAQVQALSAESDGITSSSAEEELVGRSPAMMGIFKTIGKAAHRNRY
jgi:DNA-binding NtrC family response regulator